jgi:hypothetical protein
MLLFFREGGFSMYFVVGFGLTALVAAVLFAVRPAQRKLPFLRGMSRATLYAILSGLCANLAAVGHHVPERFAQDPQWYFALILGVGESMAPGILGFTLLALTGLVGAVGARRLARLEG